MALRTPLAMVFFLFATCFPLRGLSPNPLSSSDLTTWQQNFSAPASTPTSAAVPEPGGMLLWLAASAVGILARPASRLTQRRKER